MPPLNWKVMTLTLGIFAAVMFGLCVAYGLVAPAKFHASQLLEAVLPGFQWLSPGSFVLGLVETFLYGAFAGLILTLIHNVVAARVRA
jgi:hypothetical protein